MSKGNEEPRDSDDAMWAESTTLTPAETKDAKVHVTLRLDPNTYRAILAEKKRKRERTVTATIERLLRDALDDEGRREVGELAVSLRNLVAHGFAQDAILAVLARNIVIQSAEDKQLFERFKQTLFETAATADPAHERDSNLQAIAVRLMLQALSARSPGASA
ncbi:MAG TPA: hypothetical protein VK665_05105 [Candidatus Elarobacter sp.]|nr:hypothetical protein [Candidatus Elarobacter sp.]